MVTSLAVRSQKIGLNLMNTLQLATNLLYIKFEIWNLTFNLKYSLEWVLESNTIRFKLENKFIKHRKRGQVRLKLLTSAQSNHNILLTRLILIKLTQTVLIAQSTSCFVFSSRLLLLIATAATVNINVTYQIIDDEQQVCMIVYLCVVIEFV